MRWVSEELDRRLSTSERPSGSKERATDHGHRSARSHRQSPVGSRSRRSRTTRIYLRSLDLIDLVARILAKLPPDYGFLADQLRRSAASIMLNYLEGCGRSGVADRRRFYAFAIGSAHEVAGTLDVMLRFSAISDELRSAGQDVCDHLIAMLRR